MLSTMAIETLAVSTALWLAFIHPQSGSKWFSSAERMFASNARRRRMSMESHRAEGAQSQCF
jgi:hypothetical protein